MDDATERNPLEDYGEEFNFMEWANSNLPPARKPWENPDRFTLEDLNSRTVLETCFNGVEGPGCFFVVNNSFDTVSLVTAMNEYYNTVLVNVDQMKDEYFEMGVPWDSVLGKFVIKVIGWMIHLHALIVIRLDDYKEIRRLRIALRNVRAYGHAYTGLDPEIATLNGEEIHSLIPQTNISDVMVTSDKDAAFRRIGEISFQPDVRWMGEETPFSDVELTDEDAFASAARKKVLTWWKGQHFTLWVRTPPPFELKNIDELYFLMQAILIELHKRKFYNNYHFDYKYMDTITFTPDGKIRTPDFKYKIGDETHYLEYKCRHGQPLPKDRDKVEAEMSMNLGVDKKYCHAEVLSIVPERNPWLRENKRNLRNYQSLHTAYETLASKLPKDRLREMAEERGHSTGQYLMKEATAYWKSEIEKDLKGEIPESLANKYPELDEMLEEMIDYSWKMESYLEANILWTDETTDHFPIIKKNRVNVFVAHPYNLHANKLAYMENNDIPISEFDNVWGQKATKIMHFPANLNHLEVTYKEMDDVLLITQIEGVKWKAILNFIQANELVETEIRAIKSIKYKCAYYKTESKAQELKDFLRKEEWPKMFLEENDRMETDLEALKRYKDALIEVERLKAKEKLKRDVTLAKNGWLMFRGNSELNKMMKTNYKKYSLEAEEKDRKNKENPAVMEEGDYSLEIIKDLSEWKTRDFVFKRSDYTNAYACNKTKNDMSNDLVKKANSLIDRNAHGEGFKMVWYWNSFLTSLCATVPAIDSKDTKGKEMVMFREKHTGAYVISTPRPNEITSGAIIIVGKVMRTDTNWKMTGKNTAKIRSWFGTLNLVFHGQYIYYYTNSFRLNYEAALFSQGFIYGSLNASIISLSLNQDLSNELLYWTSFLNFSATLEWWLEVLYLLDKSAYLTNTYGRKEITKMLTEQIITDSRTATMMYLLKKNHKEYSRAAAKSLDSLTGNMQGIQHPIFKYLITEMKGAMITTYWKNLYPKRSGKDITKLLFGFFKKETEFEKEYHDCPMQRDKSELFKHMSVADFFDNFVWKDKELRDEWWAYTFHNGLVYRSLKTMTDAAVAENKTRIFREEYARPAANNVAASKIMTYTKMNEYAGHPIDKVVKSGGYEGIKNEELASALLTGQAAFTKMIKESENGTNRFHVKLNLGKKAIKNLIGDRLWDKTELTVLGTLVYPPADIISFKEKDQYGPGKRAFFIQTEFSRNMNMMFDWSARAPLATTANPSDILTSKGLKKNLIIQENFKKLNPSLGTMKIIMDMSKLGDKSLADAMDIYTFAAYDSGMITIEEKMLFLFCTTCLRRRAELLPEPVAASLKKLNRRIAKRERIREKDRKHVTTLAEGLIGEMMESKDLDIYFGSTPWTADVVRNKYIKRVSGAILGGFNVIWSLCSAGYMKILTLISLKFFGRIIFIGETHSDDNQMNTLLPLFTKQDFNQECCKKVVDLRNQFKHVNGVISWADGKIIVIHDGPTEGQKEIYYTDYPDTWLSKWWMCPTLMAPKCHNQTPGGKKVGNGKGEEILQIFTDGLGRITSPDVRDANVAAEATGESVAADSMSAFSKPLNALLHFITCDANVASQILANTYVTNKFGLKHEERKINEPACMNGLIYALPLDLHLFGTDSDEGRKLSNGMSLNDIMTTNLFKLNFHTPLIFERRNISTEERMAENYSLDQMVQLLENDNDLRLKNGASTYKTINFVWDRSRLSAVGKAKIMSTFKGNIQNAGKESDTEESYKKLLDAFGPLLMVSTSSLTQKVVGLMNQKEKPGGTKIRQSEDSKLIGMWGVRNRQMQNPFTAYALSGVSKEKYKQSMISYKNIFKAMRDIASNPNFKMPHLHEACYLERISMLAHIINHNRNFYCEFEEVDRREPHGDMGKTYIEVKPIKTGTHRMKYIVFSLYLMMYALKHPEEPPSKNPLYIWEPEIRQNTEFNETFEAIKLRVAKLGIHTHEEINRYSRLIVNMYTHREYNGILQMPDDNPTPLGYTALNYTQNTILELSNVADIQHDVVNDYKSNPVLNPETLERVLVLGAWICQLNSLSTAGSEIYFNKLVVFNAETEMYKALLKSDLGMRQSMMCNSFCLRAANDGIPLEVSIKKEEYTTTIVWSFSNWPKLVLTGVSSEQRKDTRWKIEYYVSKTFQNGPTDSTLLLALSSMITFSYYRRTQALSSINDIEMYSGPELPPNSTVYMRFGNKLVIRGQTAPPNMPIVHMLQITEDTYKAKWREGLEDTGVLETVGMRFGNHLITPWVIHPEPTGLQMKIIVDKRTINYNDRPQEELDEEPEGLCFYSKYWGSFGSRLNSGESMAFLTLPQLKVLCESAITREIMGNSFFYNNIDQAKIALKLTKKYCLNIMLLYNFVFGTSSDIRILEDDKPLPAEASNFTTLKMSRLMLKCSELTNEALSNNSMLGTEEKTFLKCVVYNQLMLESINRNQSYANKLSPPTPSKTGYQQITVPGMTGQEIATGMLNPVMMKMLSPENFDVTFDDDKAYLWTEKNMPESIRVLDSFKAFKRELVYQYFDIREETRTRNIKLLIDDNAYLYIRSLSFEAAKFVLGYKIHQVFPPMHFMLMTFATQLYEENMSVDIAVALLRTTRAGSRFSHYIKSLTSDKIFGEKLYNAANREKLWSSLYANTSGFMIEPLETVVQYLMAKGREEEADFMVNLFNYPSVLY